MLAWVKAFSFGDRRIVEKGININPDLIDWQLGLDASGSGRYKVRIKKNMAATTYELNSPFPSTCFSPGEWHLYAFTWDAATTNLVTIYLNNGEIIRQSVHPQTPGPLEPSAQTNYPVTIGAFRDGSNNVIRVHDGDIDEVRFLSFSMFPNLCCV